MLDRNVIIRAWKDPEFRKTLTEAELAELPPNPAGMIEISDEDLGMVAGGAKNTTACTAACSITCNCDPTFGSIACGSVDCPSVWCTMNPPYTTAEG